MNLNHSRRPLYKDVNRNDLVKNWNFEVIFDCQICQSDCGGRFDGKIFCSIGLNNVLRMHDHTRVNDSTMVKDIFEKQNIRLEYRNSYILTFKNPRYSIIKQKLSEGDTSRALIFMKIQKSFFVTCDVTV